MGFNETLTAYGSKGVNIAVLRETERLKKQQEEYIQRSGLSI
jgi:hypothetical protein